MHAQARAHNTPHEHTQVAHISQAHANTQKRTPTKHAHARAQRTRHATINWRGLDISPRRSQPHLRAHVFLPVCAHVHKHVCICVPTQDRIAQRPLVCMLTDECAVRRMARGCGDSQHSVGQDTILRRWQRLPWPNGCCQHTHGRVHKCVLTRACACVRTREGTWWKARAHRWTCVWTRVCGHVCMDTCLWTRV